jgi:hypothetical protein
MDQVVELSLPCANLEGFRSRVVALADVMKRIRIPDNRLPAKELKDLKGNPLTMLRRALEIELGKRGRESIPAVDAVRMMQNANDVRSALEHGGMGQKLTTALAKLGIEYPVPDYERAWNTIRRKLQMRSLRFGRQLFPCKTDKLCKVGASSSSRLVANNSNSAAAWRPPGRRAAAPSSSRYPRSIVSGARSRHHRVW